MHLSAAGFETTATTLMWWILAMVAFPEVQRRAQGELDAVLGRARFPTYTDAPRLPYVRATSEKLFAGDPLSDSDRHTKRQKMTGTRVCSFQKARYADPIYGNAIATGPYLVTMRMTSSQRGILETTVTFYQAPEKRIRKVM